MSESKAYARPACGPCLEGDHTDCCWPRVPCACHELRPPIHFLTLKDRLLRSELTHAYQGRLRDELGRLRDELPCHTCGTALVQLEIEGKAIVGHTSAFGCPGQWIHNPQVMGDDVRPRPCADEDCQAEFEAWPDWLKAGK